MRSQWIDNCPLKPIYLVFLLLQVYYLVISPHLLLGIFLICSLGLVCYRYGFTSFWKIAVLLSLFGLGLSLYHHHQKDAYRKKDTQISQLHLLPDTISINGDLVSFRANQGGKIYQAFYQLKSIEEKQYFEQVTKPLELTVKAEIQEASQKRNFSGFDYREYLYYQGIHRVAQIDSIVSQKAIKHYNPFLLLREWRRVAIVRSQTFPDPMRHYMTGLLFGYLDKSFEEMSDIYTNLGIIHLFALSGAQVGFFIYCFRYVCFRCGLTREATRLWQIPFSFLYGGLTGFGVSVSRSLIQSLLSQYGVKRLDNFALTFIIMLIAMPYFLMTSSGLLSFSFAFLLALIDVGDRSRFKAGVVTTLWVSLGILPILMLLFASFQPLSLILTAMLSFLFDSLMLPLLSLSFIVSPFIRLSFFNPLFHLLESILTTISHLVERPFILGSPHIAVAIVMLILIGFLYDYHKHQKQALCLAILLISLFSVTKHPLTNEVTIVDVGQGDSIVIRDSWGKTIVIDVGGKVTFAKKEPWQERHSDSNAERTLLPYLRSRGIARIDQLVLTHTDTDHMGDMEVIAKQIAIGEVLVSSGSLTNADFVNRLNQMKVAVKTIQAGDSLEIMGSQLQVLYPMDIGDGKNNDSIVLYGQLLGLRFLLTGDLEKEGEERLIASYPDLAVDVLKAGHHGSKGSSSLAFLQHINPRLTLISAGLNNRYQHPHQETLERLEEVNSSVLRTDQSGAIRFIGLNSWHIETVIVD